MQTRNETVVYGREGLRGSIAAPPGQALSGPVRVHLERGGVLNVPAEILVQRRDGAYDLPLGPAEVEPYLATAEAAGEPPIVIPVAEEQLRVGKQRVESGKVVVRKVVREHEEEVRVPLVSEEVEVERVAVNRYLDKPVDIRQEGDVTIVPVFEEVVVVEKRLLLKEELHVRRRRKETQHTQTVTVRAEEVRVERADSEAAAQRLQK